MSKRKGLSDLETENKQLKHDVETLKLQNAELREENNRLKQSQASSTPRPSNSESPATSETADGGTDNKLQRKLSVAVRQLSETRKQLLDVKSRLAVNEQVTAVTQRRQLMQEGVVCQNLPTDSVYEELRFDSTQEHVYDELQPSTHAGCYSVCSVALSSLILTLNACL